MRKFLLVLAAMLAWAAAAPAADLDLTSGDRAAIQGTIRGQMEAFQRDDAAAAFALAAPAIQAMFGTPEKFISMVRNTYLAVYRPREVEFRDLVTIGDIVVQQVLVVGPEGRAQIALYTMERQPDGLWRIGGCTLVASPEKAI